MQHDIDPRVFAEPSQVRAFPMRGGRQCYAGEQPKRLAQISVDRSLNAEKIVTCSGFFHSRLRKYFYQRREMPPFATLEFVLKGAIYLGDGDNRYLAEAGDLCIMHPGRTHELVFVPGKTCEKIGMVLEGKMLDAVLAGLGLDAVDVIRVDYPQTREIIEEIVAGMRRADQPHTGLLISGGTLTLLQYLAESSGRRPVSPLADAVMADIREHAAEDFSMNDLAKKHCVSVPTMNRAFHAATGMTPYQYLIQVRMRRAVALLGQDRLRVKEIALAVGYRDPLHFSGEFRRLYGKSPREYRQTLGVE